MGGGLFTVSHLTALIKLGSALKAMITKNFRNCEMADPPGATNVKISRAVRGREPLTQKAGAASPMVQTLANRATCSHCTDQELLRQFLARADDSAEAAFATLVERHGPIVHGVCRDILGDLHESQDAAQAVFLVLSKCSIHSETRVAVAS